MYYSMTLNPGFGSRVEVEKLGIFKRGVSREVDLSKDQLEQFGRGKMWLVAPAKPKKAKAPAKEKE